MITFDTQKIFIKKTKFCKNTVDIGIADKENNKIIIYLKLINTRTEYKNDWTFD